MSFDSLAPHYGWMETVLAGEKLQRCRVAFLNAATHSRNILIAGEGNGRFLLECGRVAQNAHITCVDASAPMLALARRRLEGRGVALDNIEFQHRDLLDWTPPSRSFDLIVTHFFLDCFPPSKLARVVEKLAGAAKESAIWLLADFQIPPAGLRRCRAQLIHRLMYAFFVLTVRLPARRLTSPDPFLRGQGFALVTRRETEWGLLHTDLWTRSGLT
jgi:ubiquinone/menaquinone biosynthesis C-methylase UbiE